MAMKTSAFDSAEYLDSPEAIETYLEDALESNGSAIVAHALGAVARAKGMSRIAQDAGLSREAYTRRSAPTVIPNWRPC